MAQAADRMNELEKQYPELARESEEWVNAELTATLDMWDPDFEAQATRRKSTAIK